mmetsp:Transcript_58105/g.173407  ORF Transcript_58105/g.173407 Transcript_58105/m.173407 type:complete len:226 (+) Transcript_58105:194-871(+)
MLCLFCVQTMDTPHSRSPSKALTDTPSNSINASIPSLPTSATMDHVPSSPGGEGSKSISRTSPSAAATMASCATSFEKDATTGVLSPYHGGLALALALGAPAGVGDCPPRRKTFLPRSSCGLTLALASLVSFSCQSSRKGRRSFSFRFHSSSGVLLCSLFSLSSSGVSSLSLSFSSQSSSGVLPSLSFRSQSSRRKRFAWCRVAVWGVPLARRPLCGVGRVVGEA